MAKLKVELKGEDIIDNAVIYLEDPPEKIPHFLNPKNDKEWECKKINVPVVDNLDYSLYVIAFNGTKFNCTVTNIDTEKKVEFSGVTGEDHKNWANESGSKKFN